MLVLALLIVVTGLGLFLHFSKDTPKQEAAAPSDCLVVFAQANNLILPGRSTDEAYNELKSSEQRCTNQQDTDKVKQFTYHAVFAWIAYNRDADKNIAFEHANKAENLLKSLTPAELDRVQDRQRITNNLITVLNSQTTTNQRGNQ